MKKIKSIWLIATALLAITNSSVEADVAFLRLSPSLQKTYSSWHKTTGSIVFPCIEYKYDDKTYKTAFFSDKEWFNTSVQIPSDLLEFDIYLPTTMFGKYIKFTFKSSTCRFPAPNFAHVEDEILREIFCPSPESFISDGFVYTIDVKYILNQGKPFCAQCMLIPENQPLNNILVCIGDLP